MRVSRLALWVWEARQDDGAPQAEAILIPVKLAEHLQKLV